MTNENKQRLSEELDDAALKLLMEEYVEIEGEALWREFLAAEAAGNEPPAPTRENRIPGRGSKENNRRIHYLKFFGSKLRHAAVIFLVLLCLLSPLVMTVEAFKIPVINYFVTLKDTFSGFDFGRNEAWSNEQGALIDLIVSTPCPEGCSISKQEVTSDGKILVHLTYKGKNAVRISIYPPEGQINIDTEDVEQIPIRIKNYDTLYLRKEGHRIMWIDPERKLVFNIRSREIGEDDFWRYVYKLIENLSQ